MTRKKQVALGLAVLFVIAVIAALIFWLLPPSKKDFVAAKAVAEKIKEYKVTTSFREFTAATSAAYKENKSYDHIVTAATEKKKKLIDALNARSENAAKIKQSRVMKDKDVEAAYATYLARENKYSTYLRNYADTYPAYLASFGSCDAIYQVTKQTRDIKAYAGLHKKAAEGCLKDLTRLSKMPHKPLADFAKEYIRIVNGRQKVFDGIANDSMPIAQANDAMQQLSADVSNNNPTDELTALNKDSRFNGELNALSKLLGEKAEQAK